MSIPQKIGHVVGLVLGVALIVVIPWGIYRLSLHAISTLALANTTVVTSVITASGAVLVAVASVLLAKHLENSALLRKEQREKKAPSYEKIISFLFTLVMAEKIGKVAFTEQDMVKEFSELSEKILVWGSDEVLITWRKLRLESNDTKRTAETVADLLLAIRHDLGHNNKNITRKTILGVFINEIDTIQIR